MEDPVTMSEMMRSAGTPTSRRALRCSESGCPAVEMRVYPRVVMILVYERELTTQIESDRGKRR